MNGSINGKNKNAMQYNPEKQTNIYTQKQLGQDKKFLTGNPLLPLFAVEASRVCVCV